MACVFARRGAALLQRRRQPSMGGEAPARLRRLVDSASHDRMTEAKAARQLGRPDEIRIEQLVEQDQRLSVVDVRRDCRELWVEWVAEDGGTLQHRAGFRAQRAELARECGGDRLGNLGGPGPARHGGRPPARPARSSPKGRTGCRRSRGAARLAPRRELPCRTACRRPRARGGAGRGSRSRDRALDLSAAAARVRCGERDSANARSTGRLGRRRSRWERSSIEAPSAHWTSSRASTSGRRFAKSASSAPTARCER